jgi:hypothetical protein
MVAGLSSNPIEGCELRVISWRQSSIRKMAARKYYVPNGIRDDTGLKMQPSGDVSDIMRQALRAGVAPDLRGAV